LGTLVTVDGTTCYAFTCYIGNTCARTTWTLEPLVTGLVEPLGPLMQGLLETPGLTVAGQLVHGQVKEAPMKQYWEADREGPERLFGLNRKLFQ
jgi:hypothetical protein